MGLQHGIDVGPEQKIGKADNASANPRRPVDTARAATVPVDQVLAALAVRGVDRIEDFFDRNAAAFSRSVRIFRAFRWRYQSRFCDACARDSAS